MSSLTIFISPTIPPIWQIFNASRPQPDKFSLRKIMSRITNQQACLDR
jgi:hypothetical protein